MKIIYKGHIDFAEIIDYNTHMNILCHIVPENLIT